MKIEFDSRRLQAAGGLVSFVEFDEKCGYVLVLPFSGSGADVAYVVGQSGRRLPLSFLTDMMDAGAGDKSIAARLEDIGSPSLQSGEVSGSTSDTDGGEAS